MNSKYKFEENNERINLIAQNGNDGLHYSTPEHYDNEKGSLYKIAVDRNWNAYQFDAVKRIDRCEKKGEFENDINKTIEVLKMYKLNK